MAMADVRNGPKMTATPEEQEAAFQKARGIVEKILPEIEEENDFIVSIALQLMIARQAYLMKKSPKEILGVIAFNLPTMIEMWKNAYRDVDQGIISS